MRERNHVMSVSREERLQAKAEGLPFPEAGVPNIKAIEKVFGFSPEDIRGNFSGLHMSTLNLGKLTKHKFTSMADEDGQHLRYGADTEI